MVAAHLLCLCTYQLVVQVIEDPEAEEGSEDCVHTPSECAGCQRNSEGEDRKFVGSAPRLEPEEVPMPSPDWHLEVGIEIDRSEPVTLIYFLAYPWDREHSAPKGSQKPIQTS